VEHDTPEVALTIGVFDGVHRGHQDLVRRMVESARRAGLAAHCITFDPDPEAFLRPERPPKALTDPGERSSLLRDLGVECVEVVPFDAAVASETAEQFLRDVSQRCRPRQIWVGEDFALGHDRAGTVPVIRELGRSMGFDVTSVPLLMHAGRPISSSWVRSALASGDVGLAERLLGRPYTISGIVEPGARRGRLLGFPTANVSPPPGRALPADGVYFVMVTVTSSPDGPDPSPTQRRFGVVNLGGRPTFDEAERLLETHILDFAGDLYGARLAVSFLAQLRGTQRFASIDELRLQIDRDVDRARKLVAERSERS